MLTKCRLAGVSACRDWCMCAHLEQAVCSCATPKRHLLSCPVPVCLLLCYSACNHYVPSASPAADEQLCLQLWAPRGILTCGV